MPPIQAADHVQLRNPTFWEVISARIHEARLHEYVAEFAGTGATTFMYIAACDSSYEMKTTGLIPVALAFGRMALVYGLAPVCGGHLNPAISISVGLVNKGSWRRLLFYMLWQSLGGLFGGWLATAFNINAGTGNDVAPKDDYGLHQCFVIESVYTMLLCFVFLNVTLSRKTNNFQDGGNMFHGLASGFSMIAGVTAGFDISGAFFNPAIALGVKFANPAKGQAYFISYIFFQVVGAVFASVFFRMIRPAEMMQHHHLMTRENKMHEKGIAEGLGTLFIVFTYGVTTLSPRQAAGVATAASYVSMLYAVRDVSGGHFNPAITAGVLATGLDRKLTWKVAVGFCMSQVIFALVASALYTSVGLSGEWGSFGLNPNGHNNWSYGELNAALGAEFLFTFLIVFVYLSTVFVNHFQVKGIKTPLHTNQYFGLAAGLCLLVSWMGAQHISRGVCNPAAALAIDFSNVFGGGNFWPCLLYALIELTAALLASAAFFSTHTAEFYKLDERLPAATAAVPVPKATAYAPEKRQAQPKQKQGMKSRRAERVERASAAESALAAESLLPSGPPQEGYGATA